MLGHAALRPTERAFHRPLLVAARVHQRGQLVEREHDVGADLVLDAHRDLGAEAVQRAVERRLERHAVLIHERQALLAFGDHVVGLHAGHVHRQRLLEPGAQREHLEPARIGERGPVPVHESAETARRVQNILAGALVEMERVRQQALRAQILHRLRQHRLHRGLRGHRHERGCADVAVRGVDDAGAAIACAAAALAVGGVGQTGDGFERERVAVAGLAGFRAAGMLKQTGHTVHSRRSTAETPQ